MPDKKVKYANFPERDLKVVIGTNINAATTKTLCRLSIGTYEMSFLQQERATLTSENARQAMNHLAKAMELEVTPDSHRDFVCIIRAQNAEHRYTLWVTTPFELTQSAHIIWIKYEELGGEKKIGVHFKMATGFTCEDIENILKVAPTKAEVLEPGAPFVLKGNPPPRFAKKKKAEDAPAEATSAAEAPVTSEQPAAEKPAE